MSVSGITGFPGANVPLEKLCHEWADKEKVDLKVDFITSNGGDGPLPQLRSW
ncbi:MAG: hypothetical protein WCA23_02185 [Stellaceae bacterium]